MPKFWPYLIMKVESPLQPRRFFYFVNKCLPFGAVISCSHFQRFSNAIAHVVSWRMKKPLINYLDDFLFAALFQMLCNAQVKEFLLVCQSINFPVSKEKTFWGTSILTFLGMLINTIKQTISIPVDKVKKGLNLIEKLLDKRKSQSVKFRV